MPGQDPHPASQPTTATEMLGLQGVTSTMSAMRLSSLILRALSRNPNAADYPGGTERHRGSNALEFIERTGPDFLSMIQGKRVLDYGCGQSYQSVAMKMGGAASVVAYDP